jgi:hypothetical protein
MPFIVTNKRSEKLTIFKLKKKQLNFKFKTKIIMVTHGSHIMKLLIMTVSFEFDVHQWRNKKVKD